MSSPQACLPASALQNGDQTTCSAEVAVLLSEQAVQEKWQYKRIGSTRETARLALTTQATVQYKVLHLELSAPM